MKITSPFGVKNQMVITDAMGNRWFQSYDTIVACKTIKGKVILDTYWQHSKTTSKYLGRFLNEDSKAIHAKIKSGEYILDDLQTQFSYR